MARRRRALSRGSAVARGAAVRGSRSRPAGAGEVRHAAAGGGATRDRAAAAELHARHAEPRQAPLPGDAQRGVGDQPEVRQAARLPRRPAGGHAGQPRAPAHHTRAVRHRDRERRDGREDAPRDSGGHHGIRPDLVARRIVHCIPRQYRRRVARVRGRCAHRLVTPADSARGAARARDDARLGARQQCGICGARAGAPRRGADAARHRRRPAGADDHHRHEEQDAHLHEPSLVAVREGTARALRHRPARADRDARWCGARRGSAGGHHRGVGVARRQVRACDGDAEAVLLPGAGVGVRHRGAALERGWPEARDARASCTA